MKRYFYFAIIAICCACWCACEDVETYAEMKEKEKACIYDFISEQDIKVIDMVTFEANGFTTDTTKNEYVLFKDKGIYMQIVRKGEGKVMEDGERGIFMARYFERNIESGDTISGNLYSAFPDYLICKRDGDSFSASFTQGQMLNIYGSSSNGRVPSGWLVPFSYITPGRPNDKAAKVRLILPHSESTPIAAQYVYPTFFEITYIPEPNI